MRHLRDHVLHGDRVSDHVNGAQLKVDVSFTEDNTDKTVSETSYITLQSKAIQFSISHKGSNRYIPGFDFPIQVRKYILVMYIHVHVQYRYFVCLLF